MRSILTVAFACLCGFGVAHAESGIRMFPPDNCSPTKPLIAWDGNGNTYCMALPSMLPACAANQYLTSDGTAVKCVNLPTQGNTNTATNTNTNTTTVVNAAAPASEQPVHISSASPTCTADPVVCAAYQSSLGRLPDSGGATSAQTYVNYARAQGIPDAQIQQTLQNSINAALMNNSTSFLINNAQSVGGIASCTGSTGCSGTLSGTAAQQAIQQYSANANLNVVADPSLVSAAKNAVQAAQTYGVGSVAATAAAVNADYTHTAAANPASWYSNIGYSQNATPDAVNYWNARVQAVGAAAAQAEFNAAACANGATAQCQ
jgi:hypothetical protein